MLLLSIRQVVLSVGKFIHLCFWLKSSEHSRSHFGLQTKVIGLKQIQRKTANDIRIFAGQISNKREKCLLYQGSQKSKQLVICRAE